jgi:hypothetical protein
MKKIGWLQTGCGDGGRRFRRSPVEINQRIVVFDKRRHRLSYEWADRPECMEICTAAR